MAAVVFRTAVLLTAASDIVLGANEATCANVGSSRLRGEEVEEVGLLQARTLHAGKKPGQNEQSLAQETQEARGELYIELLWNQTVGHFMIYQLKYLMESMISESLGPQGYYDMEREEYVTNVTRQLEQEKLRAGVKHFRALQADLSPAFPADDLGSWLFATKGSLFSSRGGLRVGKVNITTGVLFEQLQAMAKKAAERADERLGDIRAELSRVSQKIDVAWIKGFVNRTLTKDFSMPWWREMFGKPDFPPDLDRLKQLQQIAENHADIVQATWGELTDPSAFPRLSQSLEMALSAVAEAF